MEYVTREIIYRAEDGQNVSLTQYATPYGRMWRYAHRPTMPEQPATNAQEAMARLCYRTVSQNLRTRPSLKRLQDVAGGQRLTVEYDSRRPDATEEELNPPCTRMSTETAITQQQGKQ